MKTEITGSSPAVPNTNTPSSSETVNLPDSNKPTLSVKDWGIQFSLPSQLSDLYYVNSTSSVESDGTPNTIWLGRKAFDALGCPASDANSGKKPIASITRNSIDYVDPVSGGSYMATHPGGVTIDGYYYAYESWAKSNTCVPESELQQLDKYMMSALQDAKKVDSESTPTAGN